MLRRVVSVETDGQSHSGEQWEEALSECVGRASPDLRVLEEARCVPDSRRGFSGRIEYGELGDSNLCRIETTAHRFMRTMREDSSHLAPPQPLLLTTQIRASSRFQQGERSGTLRPGDWCLLDAGQRFDWTTWTGGELLVVALQRPRDSQLHLLLSQGAGRRWDGKTGLSRIVQSMLSQTFDQLDHLTPRSARSLERTINGLTWDALNEQIERPSPLGYRDTECARVKASIETELANPDLSVASIADACGLSVRSVHRAFAADPAGSVSNYLWQRRVIQCAATLRDARQAQRSITDICMAWGFTSPAHFSRVFKAHYGVTPRAYRALD